jgi:Domain of unknown function (DUF4625)
MKKYFLLYSLLALLSCSKGSEKEKDYEAPVLILSTPVNNQVFTAGQDMTITGMATDNKFIKEIHIVISNSSTGTEYLHVHIHPNTNSFNFNQAFTAQAGIAYKIDVIVDDGGSNSTGKSVSVVCN